MSEELDKFLKDSAAGDASAEAANRRLAAAFAAAGVPPAGARHRVAESLPVPRRPVRWFALPAGGLALAAALLLLRPAPAAESPDWLSYDNFPYYADEARMSLHEPGVAVSADDLIPSAETGL